MIFNETLENVSVYETGKPIELVVRQYGIKAKNIVKLASNENPYGASKKVISKLKEIIPNASVYPDDSMYELKEKLADKFMVNEHNIIIGSGSDQIIELCIRAKCGKNSKIITSNTTFAMYEIYGSHVGAKVLKTRDDEHNLYQFSEIYEKEGADVIFLCLPNNPLGECLDTKDVYKFLDTIDENTMVVLDGAYQEFASYKDNFKKLNPSELIIKYPNVVYLGTFSKAYGLGGMRVGYGVANINIIRNLYKLRPPFNITTLTLQSAIEALNDEEFMHECLIKNFEQMKRYEAYARFKNLQYIPSYTNFITIYLGGISSQKVTQKLLEKGIILRDMTGYGLNAIRITIGTDKQNTKVLKSLDLILSDYEK